MNKKELLIANFDDLERGALNLSSFVSAYGITRTYALGVMKEIREGKIGKNRNKIKRPEQPKIETTHFKEQLKRFTSRGVKKEDRIMNFVPNRDDLSTRDIQPKKVNELPNGKTQVIFESRMNYEPTTNN